MAEMKVSGMEALDSYFKTLCDMAYQGKAEFSVVEDMLDAEADVVVRAQRDSANSMLNGKYSKGAVRDAIRKGKLKRAKNGGFVKYITFNGKQHGTRIAEIAFINEYGKKGQAARPFVRTANEKCADEALAAAEAVFDKWIETL